MSGTGTGAQAPTVVVKWGGGSGADPAALCSDIAALTQAGVRIVVVHGGSEAIAELAARLGVPLRYLTAPDGVRTRRTDPSTLDVVLLALAGRVKPALLAALAGQGVSAVGATGLDAGLVRARRKAAIRAVEDGRTVVVRDDLSGRITTVRGELLRSWLDAGLVPVLSPPALDLDGTPVNVNADRMAAAVAAELTADHLIFLTGAPGLLRQPDDEASVLTRYEIPATGPAWAGGGMAIKLVAAREALAAKCPDVRICDARSAQPLRQALDERAGTELRVPPTTER